MSKLKPNSCSGAAKQFSQTTTLHGFKYLSSKYYSDRWCWLLCCCASACCAGVLCAVLWARFLEVPALLTLRELGVRQDSVRMPLVAVCPPADTIAYLFGQQLSTNKADADRLPEILENVLRRKVATWGQLLTLEDILNKNNMTLADALMKVMPPCHSIVRNCRWQSIRLPCDQLFVSELTQWGACCIFKASELNISPSLYAILSTTLRLNVAMECSLPDRGLLTGCEFFMNNDGEGWVEPTSLSPGYNYIAQMSFTTTEDSNAEKLVDGTCTSHEHYSRTQCLLKCQEISCGCSDPLSMRVDSDRELLPPCPATKLNCLRTFKQYVNREMRTCKCLPPCKKVNTELVLESSNINAFRYTFDDIYDGLNESSSILLNIVIRVTGSKVFVVNPTETWITLLSSLGGVFNMFLGVGLFSALEIVFFLFVRCPMAVRRSTEIRTT